jgi:MFS transporter, FSR family, fosmidomycin resistance protein
LTDGGRVSGITADTGVKLAPKVGGTAFVILFAISFCHLLNDLMQVLLPAIYPVLKSSFSLSFAQIGLMTLVFQLTSSLLQPIVGYVTDKRPMPFSLPVGMGFTLAGLVILSLAPSFAILLVGAALLGTGSSIFHPESVRIARAASGGRHGLAQSVFQVGGNFGQSLGPLAAAFIILPNGQGSLAWFGGVALLGMVLLTMIGQWFRANGHAKPRAKGAIAGSGLSSRHVTLVVCVLLALIFSKFFYMAMFTSYYTFYLINHFHVPVASAQVDLFIFLAATAAGTFFGGPIGDRIGRRRVIWGSILGVLPFALILPHVGLDATIGLSVVIGLVLSSAFPAIVVYATEVMPGRVGTVGGLFFGFAFGMGGLGAAALGVIADHTSIAFVYQICAFLPAIGLLAVFLPDMRRPA